MTSEKIPEKKILTKGINSSKSRSDYTRLEILCMNFSCRNTDQVCLYSRQNSLKSFCQHPTLTWKLHFEIGRIYFTLFASAIITLPKALRLLLMDRVSFNL